MSYRYTEKVGNDTIEHIVAGRQIPNIDNATTSKTGVVKPDGETIKIDVDGTIHALTPIPITREDFDNMDPLEKRGKMFSIIDDYENPEFATTESFGFVKLSSADDVATEESYALPTTEKNPTLPGTLANQIAEQKEKGFLEKNIVFKILGNETINSSGVIEGTGVYQLVVAKVKEGQKITISSDVPEGDSNIGGFFADEPIRGSVSYDGSRIVGSLPITLTVPSGCNYVVWRKKSTNNLQVEVGESATPYVPYAKSNVELTEELMPTSGTTTTTNSKVTAKPNWYRYGKIVNIAGSFSISDVINTEVVLEGIPECLTSGYEQWVFAINDSDHKAYRLNVTGTQVKALYSNLVAGSYIISGCYIAK